jgi:CheY-like chemotaxis protein
LSAGARILVIEDDAMVRGILCRILRDAGHEVLDAENEPMGLALALEHKLEAVVMDVDLAGRDGIRAMAEIRRLQPEVPCVVVSGSDRGEILCRLEERNLRRRVWWLGKPFVRDELLSTVGQALTG